MGPLGQPQQGVRAATGNAADVWGGAVSEAQGTLASARACPRGLSGTLGCGGEEARGGPDAWRGAGRGSGTAGPSAG